MLLRGKTKTGTRSVNNNGDPLQLHNNLLVGNNGDTSSAGPLHLHNTLPVMKIISILTEAESKMR